MRAWSAVRFIPKTGSRAFRPCHHRRFKNPHDMGPFGLIRQGLKTLLIRRNALGVNVEFQVSNRNR